MRNTSHAFADELLPIGLMGGCCKPDSKLECAKVNRPQIENRELAHSNAKRRRAHSKKRNLDTGVYTKDGRYLFHDSKRILRLA